MKNQYEVVVGNIGTVYSGWSTKDAARTFMEYRVQSKSGYGRASHEPVTLFYDGEIVKEYIHEVKWFPRREIEKLLIFLKTTIGSDYRASDDSEDTLPGMNVTISTSDGSNWSYQTGDNSYTGGCYGDHHWSVITLYRRSNCGTLSREVMAELRDMVRESK